MTQHYGKMRAFIDLAVHYIDRPYLKGAAADHFRSKGFRESLQAIGADDERRRRLTISLLEHIALDPLVGSTVESFVKLDPSGDEMAFICLRLHTTANPIDSFSVKRGSKEFAELLQAIQRNLESRMFKAARVYRKVNDLRTRIIQQAAGRARAAYDKVKNDAQATAPVGLAGFQLNAELKAHRNETEVLADAAYDAVFDPVAQRTHRRVQAVNRLAFGGGFSGNGIDMLAAFATRYLNAEAKDLQPA